jgi:hypothetical protein
MSDCAIEQVVEPLCRVWQRLLQPLLVRLDAQLEMRNWIGVWCPPWPTPCAPS